MLSLLWMCLICRAFAHLFQRKQNGTSRKGQERVFQYSTFGLYHSATFRIFGRIPFSMIFLFESKEKKPGKRYSSAIRILFSFSLIFAISSFQIDHLRSMLFAYSSVPHIPSCYPGPNISLIFIPIFMVHPVEMTGSSEKFFSLPVCASLMAGLKSKSNSPFREETAMIRPTLLTFASRFPRGMKQKAFSGTFCNSEVKVAMAKLRIKFRNRPIKMSFPGDRDRFEARGLAVCAPRSFVCHWIGSLKPLKGKKVDNATFSTTVFQACVEQKWC